MIPSVAAKMRRNTALLFTLSLIALAQETIDVKGQIAAEVVEGIEAAGLAEAWPIAAEVAEATAADIVEGLKEGPAAEVAEEGLEEGFEEGCFEEGCFEEGCFEGLEDERQSQWGDWVKRGELDWLQWGELDWPERLGAKDEKSAGPEKKSAGPEKKSAGPEKKSAGPEKKSAGPEKKSAGPERGEESQWEDSQWEDWVQRGELDWLQWGELDWPETRLGANRTAVGGIKLMAGLSSLIIFATIVIVLILLKFGKRKKSGRKDSAFHIKSLCNVSA